MLNTQILPFIQNIGDSLYKMKSDLQSVFLIKMTFQSLLVFSFDMGPKVKK